MKFEAIYAPSFWRPISTFCKHWRKSYLRKYSANLQILDSSSELKEKKRGQKQSSSELETGLETHYSALSSPILFNTKVSRETEMAGL